MHTLWEKKLFQTGNVSNRLMTFLIKQHLESDPTKLLSTGGLLVSL